MKRIRDMELYNWFKLFLDLGLIFALINYVAWLLAVILPLDFWFFIIGIISLTIVIYCLLRILIKVIEIGKAEGERIS